MKHLRIFLLLVLVVAMLTACGGGTEGTEAPTTLATEAPTTVPTEAPTTVPTEAPVVTMKPITNFYFDEPEGFVTMSVSGNTEILAGPDGDGSSITIMALEIPMDFSELTEENFSASLGLLGDDGAAPTLNAMEATEIDGYPACLLDYTMTVSGITARYSTYYVTDGASTVAFTFADASAEGKWGEAFAAAAGTINLLNEGEFVPADTDGLELYDLGCGLSMYAVPGMESLTIDGYAAVLANESFTILVIQDNKDAYSLYGMTVEDYASLYTDGVLITEFTTDACGNTAAAFLNQGDDGATYFYYAAAKNTADDFYLIQCACNQDQAMAMAGEFAQWCATVVENP